VGDGGERFWRRRSVRTEMEMELELEWERITKRTCVALTTAL
jgi:hypothetical protein